MISMAVTLTADPAEVEGQRLIDRIETIILDSIRNDAWRILVGDDAQTLDRLVRESPEPPSPLVRGTARPHEI